MSINPGPCRGNSLPANHMRSRMTSQNENRHRSITDISNITSPKHPEPFLSIPAQILVKDNCRVHCGMVRKENRFNNWQDRYLVLHKGCLYYYKDSTDKSAKGQFSLSGYRLSTAPEKTKYEWTFKLTHIQPEKRKYYFSAHSEKELSEWFEKINEDMKEYCEAVRTRSGYTPESVQDIYNGSSSCSSSCSGEDTDKEYDYPIVDPPNFDEIREQLLQRNSQFSNLIVTIPEDDSATYCPPPLEFLQAGASVKTSSLPSSTGLSRTTFTSTPVQHTEHKNVTITQGGKASVDVSTILKRENTTRNSDTVPDTPPKPALRKALSQNNSPASVTRPDVPPRPKPLPKSQPSLPMPQSPPLPKPQLRPPTASSLMPSENGLNSYLTIQDDGGKTSQWSGSEQCDEGGEDYLDIIPTENDDPPPAPKMSSLERMRPDGISFKAKHFETPTTTTTATTIPASIDVLPDTAHREDLNKTDAIPLLMGNYGMYMIHSSRGGDIQKALSVCTGEKVKHFLLFRNREGYALDPQGPRFKTKRNLLVYYHENTLPNQGSAVLKRPFT